MEALNTTHTVVWETEKKRKVSCINRHGEVKLTDSKWLENPLKSEILDLKQLQVQLYLIAINYYKIKPLTLFTSEYLTLTRRQILLHCKHWTRHTASHTMMDFSASEMLEKLQLKVPYLHSCVLATTIKISLFPQSIPIIHQCCVPACINKPSLYPHQSLVSVKLD